ncbi:PhzF family phenazine biosynthesis protein [Granulicella tundricola]|uniref:PhzF family phenazine biosynthesis protein n=1 Tax=Granulicella tundricola TaxID=940615 RepID=UPI0002ED18F5|nr:PhzF family phenazine biosynthesis protein [Granulicella tundricola]
MPTSRRTLEYAIVDVFAERALEGNMLAIFTDARGLTTEQMQALARETNLSETTFIVPRDEAVEREQGVQVRIFTTQEELRFAGHPTLGTASWLYWNHPVLAGAEKITLELPVGPIPVRFDAPAEGEDGVFGTMRQNDASFGQVHDPETISRVLGIPIEDLDTRYPIQTVSTGMAFCIVPLRSVEALGRLAIPQQVAQTYLDTCDAKFFHCITPAQDADFRARMQFYTGEDPATGSASGCAIAWLVRYGLVESEQQVVIEQGVEMLRPSRISVRAKRAIPEAKEFPISDVFVGGRTIPVATGRFFLPFPL